MNLLYGGVIPSILQNIQDQAVTIAIFIKQYTFFTGVSCAR